MNRDDDDRIAGVSYQQWQRHLRDDTPQEWWHLLDLSPAAYEAACAGRDEEADA